MKTENQLTYTLDFGQITLNDTSRVGGKNASLGELYNSLRAQGVSVLDGFATTADAYRSLLAQGELEYELRSLVSDFDPEDVEELRRRGHAARVAVLDMPLPKELRTAIIKGYERLCERLGYEPELAVRPSATAEDLPEASCAGGAETFLNVRGREALVRAVHQCFASLFTDRAISYRARLGYDQLSVVISVGVQPMVRSDKASSGEIFTLDTESGFRDVVLVSSAFGLGEYVVQGVVTPDEWVVFKPTLEAGCRSIIGRRLGTKEVRLVCGDGGRSTRSEATPAAERQKFSLTDDEVLKLARWACLIEEHYFREVGHPQAMDIEWAKDGVTGKLFVVQARPETVHSAKGRRAAVDFLKAQLKGTKMRASKLNLTVLATAIGGAAAVAVYALFVRPWHLRWGATDEELNMSLPGDQLVEQPKLNATHAITINAPVADVWPWLVQVGQKRGGFYSYAWLENLVGCQMHNADQIVPEWQELKVGDEVWLHPKAPPLKVLAIEPERAIVLENSWTFFLNPTDDHTTRLIIRGRGEFNPDLKNALLNFLLWRGVFEPAHFMMERKMMLGIKERAEAA